MIWSVTITTMVVVTVMVLIMVVILHWSRYYYYNILTSKRLQIHTTVQELHRMINDICYRCEIPITYRLIVDDILSFTEVNDDPIHNIHLVVWNEQYKRPYNLNSLLLTVLSELSAITATTEQTQLLSIAQQLGYYDVTSAIEDIPGMRATT